jgi:hypothetical protein
MKKFDRSEITKRAWNQYRKGIIDFAHCMKWSWGIAKDAQKLIKEQAERLAKMNEATKEYLNPTPLNITPAEDALIGLWVAEAFKIKSHWL